MKTSNRTLTKTLLTGAFIAVAASNINAAIMAGTNNGDGSWTVADTTVSLASFPTRQSGTISRIVFSTLVTRSIPASTDPFRRANDLSTDVTGSGSSRADYATEFGGFISGAQEGSNNYLLLSLEPGESFFSSGRRHTRLKPVTGAQTCALPIFFFLYLYCRI